MLESQQLQRRLFVALAALFAFGVCDRLIAVVLQPDIMNLWTSLASAGCFVAFLIQRR